MNIRLLTKLLALTIMISCCGCASAQVLKPTKAHVRLTTSGRLYVGNNETSLKKLARQLKKNDITPATQVIIEIPKDTPAKALTAISRQLASNGYRRILFSKPREATAEKGQDPLLKDIRK